MEDLTEPPSDAKPPPDAEPPAAAEPSSGTKRRVVVVTGASSGIGLAAAEELAGRGWSVALVGRDPDRLASATERVRAAGAASGQGGDEYAGQEYDGPARYDSFQCDFAVLDQVRQLAKRLREAYPRIDVLANNAGGRVSGRHTTVDGHEETIQTNHLAPFLLSHALRDALRGGRIVNTSSGAHQMGRLDPADLSSLDQSYRPMTIYGSAKQANILFTVEAARRWPDILSTAFHPGLVRTRFGHDSAMIRLFLRLTPGVRLPAKGAQTLVWLATTDAGALTSGTYYMDCREQRVARRAADPAVAATLWEASLVAVQA